VSGLGAITAEPTDPGPGASRGELLADLDGLVAKTVLDGPIDPLLSVQIRHLGGALARPSDGAAPALTEPYSLYLFGVPSTPEAAAAIRTRQEEIVRALAPVISGRKPYTYLAPGETAAPRPRRCDLRQLPRDALIALRGGRIREKQDARRSPEVYRIAKILFSLVILLR
jgi:hypothetical protein